MSNEVVRRIDLLLGPGALSAGDDAPGRSEHPSSWAFRQLVEPPIRRSVESPAASPFRTPVPRRPRRLPAPARRHPDDRST
jgi:hypothetical protein